MKQFDPQINALIKQIKHHFKIRYKNSENKALVTNEILAEIEKIDAFPTLEISESVYNNLQRSIKTLKLMRLHTY